MPSVSRYFLLLLSLTLVFVFQSCDNAKETPYSVSMSNRATSDSILRVAILPIAECDVLKNAHESGLADRMGLQMELIHYDALMDMDTAILSGTAHVYFQDSLRICRIQDDSIRPRILLPIPVQMVLIANKDKEITEVNQLKTNMVGLTRWSQLEQWMNSISTEALLEQMDVYHAQINSIPLRFKMLNEGLIEAAIMPQPWADSLNSFGHVTLKDNLFSGMGFYVAPSVYNDSILIHQLMLLKKVYLQSLKPSTSIH